LDEKIRWVVCRCEDLLSLVGKDLAKAFLGNTTYLFGLAWLKLQSFTKLRDRVKG
jgi:hypothetical protein